MTDSIRYKPTKERQGYQLSLPQQGHHNTRQDPPNIITQRTGKKCPAGEQAQGHTKNKHHQIFSCLCVSIQRTNSIRYFHVYVFLYNEQTSSDIFMSMCFYTKNKQHQIFSCLCVSIQRTNNIRYFHVYVFLYNELTSDIFMSMCFYTTNKQHQIFSCLCVSIQRTNSIRYFHVYVFLYTV